MKIMKDNYTINNNIDSASEQLEGVIKTTVRFYSYYINALT